jgi:hypothetical protein
MHFLLVRIDIVNLARLKCLLEGLLSEIFCKVAFKLKKGEKGHDPHDNLISARFFFLKKEGINVEMGFENLL